MDAGYTPILVRIARRLTVQDGELAQKAYLEAIASSTTADRRQQIERQLLAYCKLDTLATIKLWSKFAGTPVSI